jgi:hypothetical protein
MVDFEAISQRVARKVLALLRVATAFCRSRRAFSAIRLAMEKHAVDRHQRPTQETKLAHQKHEAAVQRLCVIL